MGRDHLIFIFTGRQLFKPVSGVFMSSSKGHDDYRKTIKNLVKHKAIKTTGSSDES